MRNDRNTVALAAGMGAVTGMRSMSGLAFVSGQLSRRSRGRTRLALPASLLTSKAVSNVVTGLAAGEMAADKLPVIPNRTQPAPLIGRAALGAVTGAAVAQLRRGNVTTAAVAGSLAAVGSSFLFNRLRTLATDRTNLPDWVFAAAEDLLVLAAGTRLAAGLGTRARVR